MKVVFLANDCLKLLFARAVRLYCASLARVGVLPRPFKASTILVVDPPEVSVYDDIEGIQIANSNTHKSERIMDESTCRPAHLTKEVMSLLDKHQALRAYDAQSTEEKDFAQYQLALQKVRNKGTLCRELLSRDDYEIVVVGFHEAHTLGHRVWNYHCERNRSERLEHALRSIYSAIDHEVGSMLQALPEHSNVFFLSTYGLRPLYPMEELTDSFLGELGYQKFRSRTKSPMELLRRLVPSTLRRGLSTALPATAQERLIASRLETSTDWSRTTAFAIPSLYTGLIRVNLQGREPQGIIRDPDYQATLERLESDLCLLTDPVTGKPAVDTVVRTCDAFECGTDHNLPDLFVDWAELPNFVETLQHPHALLRQRRHHYNRSSFHSFKGFLAGYGPLVPVAAGSEPGHIRLLDIAPTFLEILGVPKPGLMKGEPVFAASKHGGPRRRNNH